MAWVRTYEEQEAIEQPADVYGVATKIMSCITVAFVLISLAGCAQRMDNTRPPRVDHILLEISNMKESISFYHDLMGLQVNSDRDDFVTLEANGFRNR